MPTTHTTTHPTRPRWAAVGSARRMGEGIRIEIRSGPVPGSYAIDAYHAIALLIAGEPAPLHRIGNSGPEKCGTADWSDSGRMLILSIPGDGGQHGAHQISGAHICAHYLRGERQAVPVVSPPGAFARPTPEVLAGVA